MPQLRRKQNRGWPRESERHSLAARGIKTTTQSTPALTEKERIEVQRQLRIEEGRTKYGSIPKAESERVTQRSLRNLKKDKQDRRKMMGHRYYFGKKRFIRTLRRQVNRKDAHKINQQVEDYIVKDGKTQSKKADKEYKNFKKTRVKEMKSGANSEVVFDEYLDRSDRAIEARRLYDKKPEYYKKKGIKPPKQEDIDRHQALRRKEVERIEYFNQGTAMFEEMSAHFGT